EKYGKNELVEGKKKSTFQVFLDQFKDMLIIILICAAAISMFLGDIESAAVIIFVLIVNATLGTIQHLKAEQSLSSLKALSSPSTKVLRNGERIEIDSNDVVVGDIIFLEAGDYVPADGRILENYSLQVNESSLTGESESIVKMSEIIKGEEIPIGDRKNMVFSGSLVTYGRATILATAVGMDTEIGKIAQLLNDTKEKKTPLQANLDNFGKKLAIGILVICAIVFALSLYRGEAIIDAFMFAVALAVAAIPEALSSIVTIVLSLGTQKMAKENAIIRKLQAVEGLGSVSIICSDKTGTLTQNKMTVKKIFVDGKVIDSNELNLEKKIDNDLLTMSLLCNDAITDCEKEIGDPTEVALVNLGDLYGVDELVQRDKFKRLGEIPFDSDRKLMSVVYNIHGENIIATKGAVDVLLKRSTKIETSEGVRPITKEDIAKIEEINQEFSKTGLRVLSFAYRNIESRTDIKLDDENDLTFIGLISMMDPPREESAEAVRACIEAGIKPVMITGDHKNTAFAIGKDLNIAKSQDQVITGEELDKLDDKELKKRVNKLRIFARVTPNHKLRIVKAFKQNGNIVAMTGDGVNDAPAIKEADIGVAMGISGTDVTKEASSMILMDDNFETIVSAVEEGRIIYDNIRKFIRYLLSCNLGEVLTMFLATIFYLPTPMLPIQILFVNLATDGLPAIALGVDPADKDIMNQQPRSKKEGIFARGLTEKILVRGCLIGICTLLTFIVGGLYGMDLSTCRTMALSTLVMSQLLHVFECRSERHSIFEIKLFTNMYLVGAVAISILMLLSIIYIPFFSGIFHTTVLGINHW
ncbi:MAG: cation-translocating P-type ATPase, partial [Clostridium perfringens]|nr:cation-translocating P-type ATPase [Clostridium perfringens]